MEKQQIKYSTANDYSVKIPNVVIDFGNAKLHFDKQQITVHDLFYVYIKFQNYLNTFEGFYL
jgi:hypothetical protein